MIPPRVTNVIEKVGINILIPTALKPSVTTATIHEGKFE